MTRSTCADNSVQLMLHAWELGVLSEQDAERVERHLLVCDECFEKVRNFERTSELLRSDSRILEGADERVAVAQNAKQPRRRWRDYLWPAGPLLLKPGLAYFLVLLLLIPAIKGLLSGPGASTAVTEVRTLSLYPDRSGSLSAVDVSGGEDLIVSFVYRGVVSGGVYTVKLSSERGEVVYFDRDFTGFDDFETGSLSIPSERLHTGGYVLTISNAGDSTGSGTEEYRFQVVRR